MAEYGSTSGETREGIVANLSEDVLVEILARIPVKSLMRFNCVCRSWYFLISDTAFICKHFILYTNNPENLGYLLVANSTMNLYKGDAFSLVSSHDDAFFGQLVEYDGPAKIDTTLLMDFRELDHNYFTYSCHGLGLVCLRDPIDENIALWNPTTREFRILPECPKLPELPDCAYPYHGRLCYPPYIYCGLGFDSDGNDCKLVHFGYRWINYCSNTEEEPVGLYTLSTNSWKTLDVKFNGWPFPDYQTAAYINGFPWWLAIESTKQWDDTETGYDLIVSFDMNAEVFRYYELPENCRDYMLTNYSLFQLHRYVAMGLCPQDFEVNQVKIFDIWVMEELGREIIWTKIFSVGPFPNVDRYIGFWPSCSIVVLKQYSNQLIFYDINGHKTEYFKLKVSQGLDEYNVHVFCDSLVRFGGRIEF